MNFLGKFFSTDSDEEVKKQIFKRINSIGKSIDSYKHYKLSRSFFHDACITQEGRELAIKMLSKLVVHHQSLNEDLKTMDNQLVNICKDKPNQKNQKFYDKVLKTSRQLIDRNLYFHGEFSSLLNDHKIKNFK
jgi:hypothetical protein